MIAKRKRGSEASSNGRAATIALVVLVVSVPGAELRAQPAALIAGWQIEAIGIVTGGLDGVAVSGGGPLGDHVYFSAGGSIGRVPRAGGLAEILVAGEGDHLYIEVVPDGRLFAVNSFFGNLREFAVQGGTATEVRSWPEVTASEGLEFVEAGPYTESLLVNNYAGATVPSLLDLDLGDPVPAITAVQPVTVPIGQFWGPLGLDTLPGSAFGNDVYAIFQGGLIVRLDGTNQTTFATASTISEAIAFPPPGSPFGEYLYVLTGGGAIERYDPAGNVETVATGFLNTVASNTLAFSPDGCELYVAADFESQIHRITPPAACGPRLWLAQPGGAGGGLEIANSGLAVGSVYRNLFSLELCAEGVGAGPLLGLCASTPGAVSVLLTQLQFPLGTAGFHFQAPAEGVTWPPVPLPPLALEGICLDVTAGGLGVASPVARIVLQ